jgi:hypothetical protein
MPFVLVPRGRSPPVWEIVVVKGIADGFEEFGIERKSFSGWCVGNGGSWTRYHD